MDEWIKGECDTVRVDLGTRMAMDCFVWLMIKSIDWIVSIQFDTVAYVLFWKEVECALEQVLDWVSCRW